MKKEPIGVTNAKPRRAKKAPKNLMLPGNPRYQPKELVSIYGYDNLYQPWSEIELAKFDVIARIGMLPISKWRKLSQKKRDLILDITTTDTDLRERNKTKHDVNAHVELIKEIIPELKDFVHNPFTSYDKISTGYVMQFKRAANEIIFPKVEKLIRNLADLVDHFAEQPQIARTHGQHALPITVGFWLATLLYRITYNYQEMKSCTDKLRGKISGATGAYNAQTALGYDRACGTSTFEAEVLWELDLKPAMISTQILPPEAVAYFLFSATMLSASLAQLGRDGRQLMRTEIGEIVEGFESTQVGSSTMSHKRNPINFENTEGMFLKNKNEFGKVMDTLISEHQRDLVNSSVMRDFPIILINLLNQLNTLLRPGGNDKSPFIRRMKVDGNRIAANLKLSSHLIMAEPIQISLQLAGYPYDAHLLVNQTLTPLALESGHPIIDHLMEIAETDLELRETIERIPEEIVAVFYKPLAYTGRAAAKAREVSAWARKEIS